MTKERIYLDYAATAPLRSQAVEAMLPYLSQAPYNPSSLHAEGRRARAALEEARERIAGVLGAKRKEIVFTASGSEADSLAILGAARLRPGRHLVSCTIEHHAVFRSLEALASEGYTITTVPVDGEGSIDVRRFTQALQPGVTLASVMYANNEIGTVQPIERLASLARRNRALFHTDAVQAAGWLPLDVGSLGVDMMSLSAHKFGGPHGVGILYAREGTPIAPIVYGGGQEAGRRSGTEDVAGALGAAAALASAESEREEVARRVAGLRDVLEGKILQTIPRVRINGAGAARLPTISSLSFEGVAAQTLAIRLDLEGVAVSAGSACTSGVAQASHVIAALGRGDSAAVRFSLGRSTTREEIERVALLLPSLVATLRQGE